MSHTLNRTGALTAADIADADHARNEREAAAQVLAIAMRNRAAAEGFGRQMPVRSDPPSESTWRAVDFIVALLFVAVVAAITAGVL